MMYEGKDTMKQGNILQQQPTVSNHNPKDYFRLRPDGQQDQGQSDSPTSFEKVFIVLY